MIILRFILSILFYTAFASFLVIFHFVQLFCYYLIGYNTHKKSVDVLNFFLLNSLKILGTKISFHHFDLISKEQDSYLFICNHQGAFEIPGLIWKLRNYHAKFIAKKGLRGVIPSISFNLKNGGSVAIDRSNKIQARKDIENFAEKVKEKDWSIILFPEGTRSRDGVLRHFKPGGLESILKAYPDIKIVPIAIENAYQFSSKSFIQTLGVNLKYTMTPVVTLKDGESAVDCMDRIKTQIATVLKQ